MRFLRIQHVADDGTRGCVHALSAQASATSALLSVIANAERPEDEEDPAAPQAAAHGDDDSDPVMVMTHATARSLAFAVVFMEGRGGSTALPPAIPKPLWIDGAKEIPLTLPVPFATFEERVLVEQLEVDAELLVEVTQAADFLQVEGLLDVCCAVMAMTMCRSDASAKRPPLESLAALVLVRVLTFLPADEQRAALSRHASLREEMCIFAVRQWFSDLRRSNSSGQDESDAQPDLPWLMCPASLLHPPSSATGIATARLLCEVGECMIDERFVPATLTTDRLAELLEGVLVAVRNGGDDPEPMRVGIFSAPVAGPLVVWLGCALECLGMGSWLVPIDSRFIPGIPGGDFPATIQPAVVVLKPPEAGEEKKRSRWLALHAMLQRHLVQGRRTQAMAPRRHFLEDGVATVAVTSGAEDLIFLAGCGDETLPAATVWTATKAGVANIRAKCVVIAVCGHTPPPTLDSTTPLAQVSQRVRFAAHSTLERLEDRSFSWWSELVAIDLASCRHLRAIGTNFCFMTGVTSLDLGGWSVISVGEHFFARCPSLTAVTASAECSLQRMGAHAFHLCHSLTSVDLSRCVRLREIFSSFCMGIGIESVDIAGLAAPNVSKLFFADCKSLTSVTASAPCSVEDIGCQAFMWCNLLTTVNLSNCVHLRTIESHFCLRSGLTALDLGGWRVAVIADFCFAECASLTKVGASSPCGLEKLGICAFHRCTSLTFLNLAECSNLFEVGAGCCQEAGLSSLDLGGWTPAVVSSAFFSRCPSLTDVVASSSCAIERLGDGAFSGCVALTRVDLSGCDRLRTIGADFCTGIAITALDLGGWTVTKAADGFFRDCPALTSVTATAPCSLTSVGSNALSNCPALQHVDLKGCVALEEVGADFASGASVVELDLRGWALQRAGPRFFGNCRALRTVMNAPPALDTAVDPFDGCAELKK